MHLQPSLAFCTHHCSIGFACQDSLVQSQALLLGEQTTQSTLAYILLERLHIAPCRYAAMGRNAARLVVVAFHAQLASALLEATLIRKTASRQRIRFTPFTFQSRFALQRHPHAWDRRSFWKPSLLCNWWCQTSQSTCLQQKASQEPPLHCCC